MSHHHPSRPTPECDGTSTPGPQDWEQRSRELEREAELAVPWVTAATRWIAELVGPNLVEWVLDVGSGPGVHTETLALTFPTARVTAVDGAPALLRHAEARARRAGLSERLDVHHADLNTDLDRLPVADVIWASRVLHHVADQPRAVRSLAGRLQPGGLLAVVEGGLPMRFLPARSGPGSAGFPSRLDALVSEAVAEALAGHHEPGGPGPVTDWPAELAGAGLVGTRSRSFLLDVPAPAPPEVREYVVDRLGRAREMAGGALGAPDRGALDRLLDPEDPEGVARRPDLFLLSAATVHVGWREA
ncbi:class I SAM-dependent methyltransferase [Actinoalloteichus sp. AHMU CJ021]|uniref:Methyltransferase domain-containing protein n=1 Tax=Actinoalloteichus caeruleus DSM 43889 TaxID=1120930 RepID=A0ABT1JDC6_ACTCY|nr:class I SAM-dependent methyltransferase [Actinoalloteichus caeruleus]AUS81019.1 class I SAM-dependent methyltransferase [Actinoalloteichus sp. AHMU CJ021]MCP2330489.1 Methyltransferase domain-containing protein [Actinoalloteichus caeruleus DSM 43889]